MQHDELLEHYDAVVYAVGAQSDRRMGIPGEDLPGSWAATEFVAWYNGHPDFQELEFDLSGERAVVIGNGNVAVDVARMLALTPEELAPTDTTDAAIEAFDSAGIREIVMVGRRGPAQAAFTTPELIELGELAGADVIVDPGRPRGRRADRHELRAQPRGAARVRGARAGGQAEAARAAVPALAGRDPRRRAGRGDRARAQPARGGRDAARSAPSRPARRETLECGIVFRSVGYRGVALPGVPFDESRGDDRERGRPRRRRASTRPGWIKRGPSGVIGTNKKDATETVELLLEDLRDAPRKDRPRRGARRSCSSSAACAPSSTRAGRRSTSSSAPPARSSAARA